MSVNWFPGHMAKALREMKTILGQVDLIIETCDARIPRSSRNPELKRLAPQKPLILVLNKADLSDPAVTKAWLEYYKEKHVHAIACDSIRRTGLNQLNQLALSLTREKIDQAAARGRRFRPIRLLVAGIPNTGKSTLINAFSKRKAAKTADKPGLTRQLSWTRTGGQFELLDSPGVLWPKIESDVDQWHLAATGAIRDDLLATEEIAFSLWKQLLEQYPDATLARYQVDTIDEDPIISFEQAARNRGCLKAGGTVDLNRFSSVLIDEFRGGQIGRISLESPVLQIKSEKNR